MPLRYKSIPGFLSAEQIAPHYTAHYGGALRGYTAADTELQTSISKGISIEPNAFVPSSVPEPAKPTAYGYTLSGHRRL